MSRARIVASLLAAALLAALLPAAAPPAHASADQPPGHPKVLLHVGSTGLKNACQRGRIDPKLAVTEGKLYPPESYFVYMLVADANWERGIAGLQMGILYDAKKKSGVDVQSWKLCAALEFPDDEWPASGTGNLITWHRFDDCQRGPAAVAGYFYVSAYSPDQIRLMVRPVDGAAKVVDCDAAEINLEQEKEDEAPVLGYVTFGGGKGYNPARAEDRERIVGTKKPGKPADGPPRKK
jgi:hypothetical protein